MSIEGLLPLLHQVPQYGDLCRSIQGGQSRARVRVLPEALPFLVGALWRQIRSPVLLLVPRSEEARRLHENLLTWCGDDASVLHFPEGETLPFERLLSDQVTIHERLRTLSVLIDASRPEGEPPLVVASVAAMAQKTMDRDTFSSATHTLRTGQRIDLEALLAQWQRMGYQFQPVVEVPGSVSRRGGILDVFPVTAEQPVRIELWGDVIESMRLFEQSTQRSVGVIDSVTVTPAMEVLPSLIEPSRLDQLISKLDMSTCDGPTRERMGGELAALREGREIEEVGFYSGLLNRSSLLDYFPRDGLLALAHSSAIEVAAAEMGQRTLTLREVKGRHGEIPGNLPSSHLFWSELQVEMAHLERQVELSPWGADLEGDGGLEEMPFSSVSSFWGRLDLLADEVHRRAAEGQRTVAVTYHAQRMKEILEEKGIGVSVVDTLSQAPPPGSITVVQGALDQGFALPLGDGALNLLTDLEAFGISKQRRPSRRSFARRDSFLSELSPGDYMVHIDHGIGRFAGTTYRSLEEGQKEYLVLEYAEADKLYVPTDQLTRVTPYIAPSDQPPSLSRLGGQEWSRMKERVKRSTMEMAAELLSLYASRELAQGSAFMPDTPWQRELEDSFPYHETPDQITTIAEVKADMERPQPMDRLVCGDVGYGKTEIALRAAFKAVMDGMQVAVLVPTTVLAQQHYVTFSQRLSAFPARVEVLSRFRSDKEQRQIVEELAAGTIDICIGTHRLLQKDVQFRNLGLVVVDEEQRFGVAQKEWFKRLRKEVDVLTLSATPIPRTLHMSLAGVRDMSTMETPPEDRLPIKTYVSEYSDELIREAVLRELDRQGQVYFLHNRVRTIHYMADWLGQLVPEARIAVGHGQMSEGQFEKVMMDFYQGEVDVLVCTTIIESGLDIPNVNTLMVNRADTFGLSQLYQLRGRVGRGAHRAHAYFLVPKGSQLTEAAEKRLKTMLAATELGAGFRIAMKDLEIRGAGNILGREQSGHIHALGFDLYTRLLADSVEEIRAMEAAQGGETTDGHRPDALPPTAEVKVDMGIPAHLPQDYVPDLASRLGIYQRMARFDRLGDVDALVEEMRDRFGPLPWPALNLMLVLRIKVSAQKAGVESLERGESHVLLRMREEVGGARVALHKALGGRANVGNQQIRLKVGPQMDEWEEPLKRALEQLAQFRERTLELQGVR